MESNHWYTKAGEPMHWVPKKDGSGNRPTTLADARKFNLVPSVTSILKVADKPALRDWLIRQAVLAVATAPDVPGEGLDAKITRVLDTERQQDQESKQAMDRGTEIHDAMEVLFTGGAPDPAILPWVAPAYEAIAQRGKVVAVEHVIVGDGYAGRVDLWMETTDEVWLWDWKTTKKLPEKGSWSEHKLQLAAYAHAIQVDKPEMANKPVQTGNVYISTVEQGKFVVYENGPWGEAFNEGFMSLLNYWRWANSFYP